MNEDATNEPMAIGDMAMSAGLDKLAAALAKAQGEMGEARKDATNPHYGSKYADLAAARCAYQEALSNNGLSLVQSPSSRGVDGVARVRLQTMLLHESGQYLSGVLELVPVKDDPQGMGSALTYARRYAAMAMTGVAPKDDDGNAANGVSDNAQREAPTPQAARRAPAQQQQQRERRPRVSKALTVVQSAIIKAQTVKQLDATKALLADLNEHDREVALEAGKRRHAELTADAKLPVDNARSAITSARTERELMAARRIADKLSVPDRQSLLPLYEEKLQQIMAAAQPVDEDEGAAWAAANEVKAEVDMMAADAEL